MSAISFAPDEAQEIARALASVAAADGAILSREASFLDAFAMAHSVGGMTFLPQPLDVARLARAIPGADKRREVLRLCLRMALADGDYADAEAKEVMRIAAAFGVGSDELQQLTDEVRRPR
jgi:tellurite resistance protein